MIALAMSIRDHWHAVERDLYTLGLTADDIGGPKLGCAQLISIVLAAPPNTAVHAAQGTWTRTEELIANLSEQQAGVVGLNARYARPGVDSAPVKPKGAFEAMPAYNGILLDAEPVDEFTVKLKERQRIAREEAEADE